MAAESKSIRELLKPFHQRAEEAEQRLAKLEISISGKEKVDENEKRQSVVDEVQTEIEILRAEKLEAKKEIEELRIENSKLKYQIIHLIGGLHEADNKLLLLSKVGGGLV
ncbi:hypothetical protein M569_14452 [Genlisea aurea]|uniref:Uncharacterized protein n=1 Tax=Genlisea aurea TaxID=192259 RepID=S8DLJ4_9LAMI|nr:hypothetical protein M569_14452 [Genlisea aurea]